MAEEPNFGSVSDSFATKRANFEDTAPPSASLLDLNNLDLYCISLLSPKLVDGINSSPLKVWIVPLLRLAMLLQCRGQTPSTKMLGLKLKGSGYRLVLYVLLSCLLPPLSKSMKTWHDAVYLPVDDLQEAAGDFRQDSLRSLQELASMRRRWLLTKTVQMIYKIGPMIRLGLGMAFWMRFVPTADPFLWLTGCRLENDAECKVPPKLHVNYAQRRWLYEQGVQTLRILFGGLMSTAAVWKPVLDKSLSKMYRIFRCLLTSRSHEISQRNMHCPICQQNDLAIPVVTGCGHVYCYTCLFQRSSVGTRQFDCILCKTRISIATLGLAT